MGRARRKITGLKSQPIPQPQPKPTLHLQYLYTRTFNYIPTASIPPLEGIPLQENLDITIWYARILFFNHPHINQLLFL